MTNETTANEPVPIRTAADTLVSDTIGFAEIADVLGVDLRRLEYIRRSRADDPRLRPVAAIGNTFVYHIETVADFRQVIASIDAEYARKTPPRRPKQFKELYEERTAWRSLTDQTERTSTV